MRFAEGYLCDEINHYKTLTYGCESQYVIRGENHSNDAVLKSGFELRKVVSTTGPGTPAPKLEGAGFTVYRVWDLSKVDEFQKNADGTYNVQSILDARTATTIPLPSTTSAVKTRPLRGCLNRTPAWWPSTTPA